MTYGLPGIGLKLLKKRKDSENKELSHSLKKRRAETPYTMVEMAEKIGLPYPTYRDVEMGYSQGTLKTKQKIADYYKCTVGELYLNPASSKVEIARKISDITAEELLNILKKKDYPEKVQKLLDIVLSLPPKYHDSLLKDAITYQHLSRKHKASTTG